MSAFAAGRKRFIEPSVLLDTLRLISVYRVQSEWFPRIVPANKVDVSVHLHAGGYEAAVPARCLVAVVAGIA